MCGVFGIIDIAGSSSKIADFEELAKVSGRRGKDAAGVAVLDGKMVVSKNPGSVKLLLQSKGYQETIKPKIAKSKVVTGQTRLATNGSPEVDANNQPIVVGKTCLVHNGIIVNSKELAALYGLRADESDSGILAKVVDIETGRAGSTAKALKKISKELAGTYNLIVVNESKGSVVTVASNNGSLYIKRTEKAIFIASEKIFLKKVGGDEGVIRQVKPLECIEIDHEGQETKTVLDRPKLSQERADVSAADKNLTKHKFDKRIDDIKRCSKCLLPLTTPGINLDRMGICNYCHEHKKIQYGDERELQKLADRIRSRGSADCIIAFSGGRDSAYGVHYLVKHLKLHPVAVTFDWGMISDIGRRNQARMLSTLGIEQIIVAADIKKAREEIRKNLEAWLSKPDLGMVPILMQGDKTTEYYVDKIKKELGVKTVFFCRGNELEREEFKAGYCGVKNADPGGVIHHYPIADKIRLLWYYIVRFATNPKYLNSSLLSSMLGYLVTYVMPHDYIYLWHYIKWDEEKILGVLRNEYGWEEDPENEVTWRIDDGSPAFYNYLYMQMQGFTENDSFRSRQIREGILDRKEAMRIVARENRPRYGALQWYFDKVGIDGNRVLSIIDSATKRY